MATGEAGSIGEAIESQSRICGVPDALRTSELNAWPEKKVTWSISGSLPQIPAESLKECYQYAWGLWSAVCGIEPEYASNHKTAHVLLTAANLGGAYGVLADSYLAPEGMKKNDDFQAIQRYDTNEPWHAEITPPPQRKISLPIVMCHEIGHAIGLGHIAEGNLLQPSYDPRVDRPMPGDIAEAQRRYGKPKQIAGKKFAEWFRYPIGAGAVVLGFEE